MGVGVVDGEYVEAVLALVEQVPHGRVTTYGALARTVGRGGPRQVGRVMALHGDAVAWWRVVHADGRPATCHGGAAAGHLREEGVRFADDRHVDMPAASFEGGGTGATAVQPGGSVRS